MANNLQSEVAPRCLNGCPSNPPEFGEFLPSTRFRGNVRKFDEFVWSVLMTLKIKSHPPKSTKWAVWSNQPTNQPTIVDVCSASVFQKCLKKSGIFPKLKKRYTKIKQTYIPKTQKETKKNKTKKPGQHQSSTCLLDFQILVERSFWSSHPFFLGSTWSLWNSVSSWGAQISIEAFHGNGSFYIQNIPKKQQKHGVLGCICSWTSCFWGQTGIFVDSNVLLKSLKDFAGILEMLDGDSDIVGYRNPDNDNFDDNSLQITMIIHLMQIVPTQIGITLAVQCSQLVCSISTSNNQDLNLKNIE